MMMENKTFPEGFVWGVSSSAAQTEGAYRTDGRGLSIWDDFASRKSKILNNDLPYTATDFYHRYPDDLSFIKEMGIKNFRFSISWSRLLPNGIGPINPKGLDFYNRLINECLAHAITPWVTLYHWDLPLELEKRGGWTNRAIVQWFNDYVTCCVTQFGDRVKNWMVLNEPMVFTGAGYFLGVHAPGKKGIKNFAPAFHHAVLCQATAYKTIKTICPDSKVGTTFSCSLITPYSLSKKDIEAAKRIDTLLNRAFLEPALGLGYPFKDLPVLTKLKKYILPGDDDLMKVNFDFIGIQNYTREVVKFSWLSPFVKAKIIPADKRKVYRTAMDWEVYPESLFEMILKYAAYPQVNEVIVTENGASFPDIIINQEVNDQERKNFLEASIQQLIRAQSFTSKLKGYFVWSLTDNFEWSEGYKQRFGLVHVDYVTQKRLLKNSGKWFANYLKTVSSSQRKTN